MKCHKIERQKIQSYSKVSWLNLSSVQSLSRVRLFATPWIAAHQAFLSITNSWSSLRLTSIESVMPSSHLILCRPLLLLPPIPPSIRVFSSESTLRMGWPKYWSFSFSIIPSKEIPGLISFRMDWLDLLAVQGTLSRALPFYSPRLSTEGKVCEDKGFSFHAAIWSLWKVILVASLLDPLSLWHCRHWLRSVLVSGISASIVAPVMEILPEYRWLPHSRK